MDKFLLLFFAFLNIKNEQKKADRAAFLYSLPLIFLAMRTGNLLE